ncbi:hypothetical protein CPB86DRAFT_819758 [Serendipita vermifera]|nr:hypothetical protein CPB86DRAFT_819758 [Serendipita vermifera]
MHGGTVLVAKLRTLRPRQLHAQIWIVARLDDRLICQQILASRHKPIGTPLPNTNVIILEVVLGQVIVDRARQMAYEQTFTSTTSSLLHIYHALYHYPQIRHDSNIGDLGDSRIPPLTPYTRPSKIRATPFHTAPRNRISPYVAFCTAFRTRNDCDGLLSASTHWWWDMRSHYTRSVGLIVAANPVT